LKKVLVIGLDGATWDILDTMAEKTLPNIRWLKDRGSWGILTSTYPPATAPAWVSFQTGMNVFNHGCFDFTFPRNSLADFRIVNSRDIKGTPFYDLLNTNGIKTILINLPVSYPPRSRGITITCFLTPGEKFVFPQDLADEIPELRRYRILPNASFREEGRMEEYVSDIREVERIRFECAKRLFKEKEWDFFFILFSGMDWIQHEKFEDIVKGELKEYSEVLKAYKDIDSYIGWFLENLPSNTVMMLVSDHGFKQYEKTFYINTWLAQHSYLKYLTGKRAYTGLHQKGTKLLRNEEIESEKKGEEGFIRFFSSLLKRVLIVASNHPILFNIVEKLYVKVQRIVPIEPSLDLKLNPSNSTALGVKWGGIYINDRQRFSDGRVEDVNHVVESLTEELEKLKNPETGKPIFKRIHKKDKGLSAELPDIVCESDNYWVSDSFSSNRLLRAEKTTWHSKEGILLAYGPSVKEGYVIQNAWIGDVAPTILSLFGLPIPKVTDGQILKEIFKEHSEH